MRYLIILAVSVLLAACQGGSSGGGGGQAPESRVRIACLDASNSFEGMCEEFGEPEARSRSALLARSAGTEERKIVRRNEVVRVYAIVENETADYWSGYYTVAFNVTCDEITFPDIPWVLTEMAPKSVPPGEWRDIGVGGGCSAMPLGDHTLTLTIYDADALTVRDEQVVEFTLIDEEYDE